MLKLATYPECMHSTCVMWSPSMFTAHEDDMKSADPKNALIAPFSGGVWSREMCKNHKCANNHFCANISPKCANNHICANTAPSNVQIFKDTSTTNVQTWRRQMCNGSILTWNVQTSHKCANHFFHQESTTFVQTFHPQMCKQPHLCKHGGIKCVNR